MLHLGAGTKQRQKEIKNLQKTPISIIRSSQETITIRVGLSQTSVRTLENLEITF